MTEIQGMKITEVKVFPVQEEKLKAFVSIVIDQCFMVNDIKVIRGREGLFISMPSRRKKNGKFKDVAHPLNNDTRQMIERLVLGEYDRIKGAAVERREEAAAEEGERAPAEQAEAPEPRDGRGGSKAPPTAAADAGSPEQETAEGRSLEEVAELHLRDSFWTT